MKRIITLVCLSASFGLKSAEQPRTSYFLNLTDASTSLSAHTNSLNINFTVQPHAAVEIPGFAHGTANTVREKSILSFITYFNPQLNTKNTDELILHFRSRDGSIIRKKTLELDSSKNTHFIADDPTAINRSNPWMHLNGFRLDHDKMCLSLNLNPEEPVRIDHPTVKEWKKIDTAKNIVHVGPNGINVFKIKSIL